MPETAETRDDDLGIELFRRIERPVVRFLFSEHGVVKRQQQRAQDHRTGHHQNQKFGNFGVHDAERRAEAEQHEGEFTARRQTEGQAAAGRVGEPCE